MLSLHFCQRGQERPQPPRPSTLALPGLSPNLRRTRPSPPRAGQTHCRLGPLPGGRGVARDRTVGGREPQLRHELGMRGSGRQGAGASAGQCGRMGGSRRTVDVRKKKDEACWLWWAIDRGSKQVCGWALGDRSTKTAERLDAQLPHAAHIKFCTDFWHPYGLIFQTHQHRQGKAYTFTIESWNNRIRIYLARLRRKTHCYSKSTKNLAASILLFLLRKCNINT